MPTLHLTDIAVQRLKSDGAQTTYWDDALPAFGIRVGRRNKTWVVMFGERRQRRTVGHYPTMSLADARTEAKKLLAFKPQFVHITFGEALENFLAIQKERTRPVTFEALARLLRKHFLPKLAKRPLGEIKPAEVLPILDGLVKTPSTANHAFTAGRQFFRWAQARGYCTNPFAASRPPATTHTRERVLTDKELVRVWNAADPVTAYGKLVRLLILTGQRRGEISKLVPEWIADKTITLPGTVTKNHRNHILPIGTMTADLLTDLPFPWFQWNDEKLALDKVAGVTDWCLHDLRRTYATKLAELGVAPHIIERLLNHITGTVSGVAAIYNRAKYDKECRAAVELWDAHLTKLLQADTAKLAA